MKNFKKSILSQLDNLNNNNPKAYWKLIESLKDKDICYTSGFGKKRLDN